MNCYHKKISHIIEYGYNCPIEPLIYVYQRILVHICLFLFPIIIINCLCSYKVIIKQQKYGSSYIRMNYYHKKMSHFVVYGYHCPIDPLICIYGKILVDICSFICPITQIQCLGHHKVIIKQQKNGYSYINMNYYHIILLPFCRLWISFSNRSFDICILVNIVSDMLIYISNYSGSVFWSS